MFAATGLLTALPLTGPAPLPPHLEFNPDCTWFSVLTLVLAQQRPSLHLSCARVDPVKVNSPQDKVG